MNTRIEKLKAYVLEHPPIFEKTGVDSALDTLYWNYTESNLLENNTIKENFRALYQCIEHLELRNVDKVIDIVCTLCTEHQRISFAAGVQVGVQLIYELQG